MFEATLYNISRRGGMVHSAGPHFDLGDLLFLRLGNMPWCSAQVVWHFERYAGVMFDNALQEVVVRQLSGATARSALSFTDPRDRHGHPILSTLSMPMPRC